MGFGVGLIRIVPGTFGTLAAIPIYWALGRITAGHRTRHEVVIVASAALLGLMTPLFVNWYYVL